MEAATVQRAAAATGWSPRMLRYVERTGLLRPGRSSSRYRLYGPEQLRRLRELRDLLAEHGLSLGDVAFAHRLREEPGLAAALDRWFESAPERPRRATRTDWVRWEQEKHERLLAIA